MYLEHILCTTLHALVSFIQHYNDENVTSLAIIQSINSRNDQAFSPHCVYRHIDRPFLYNPLYTALVSLKFCLRSRVRPTARQACVNICSFLSLILSLWLSLTFCPSSLKYLIYYTINIYSNNDNATLVIYPLRISVFFVLSLLCNLEK